MSVEPLIRHPLGTTFKKEYKGKDVVVKVTKDGYVYNGKPYRSINQAVKAITKGKPVSATVFFGLEPTTKKGTKEKTKKNGVDDVAAVENTSTGTLRDLIREEILTLIRQEVRAEIQSFRNKSED